jgi:hypothetical protein
VVGLYVGERQGVVTTLAVEPLGETAGRKLIVPLAAAFLVLDVASLALLGPVSPNDTIGDVTQLYAGRSMQVLVSRLLHCLGLVVVFGFVGLVAGRLREAEGGAATLTRVFYGGLVALVPIEVVRNVLFAALALRHDDFGTLSLPLHVFAVLLGPSIAVPVAPALAALAVLRRSRLIGAVAMLWVLSLVRLVTLSSVVWYGGLVAFAGLLVVVVTIAVQLSRPGTPRAAIGN